MNRRSQHSPPSNARTHASRLLALACTVLLGCSQGPIVVGEILLQDDDPGGGGADRPDDDSGAGAAGTGLSGAGSAGSADDGGSADDAGSAGDTGTAGSAAAPMCGFPSWLAGFTFIVASNCTIPLNEEGLLELIEQYRRDNPQPPPEGESREQEGCDFLGTWVYRPMDSDLLKVCPTPCALMERLVRDTWGWYLACMDGRDDAP